MRPSGAKPKAVTSSSMLTDGLSRDWARAFKGKEKKEITQRAQRGRRPSGHGEEKWRAASGERRVRRCHTVGSRPLKRLWANDKRSRNATKGAAIDEDRLRARHSPLATCHFPFRFPRFVMVWGAAR